MTCKEIEKLVLDDAQAVHQEEVHNHLQSCMRCQKVCRELLSLKELSSLLGDSVRAPDNFSSRVHDQWRARFDWRRSWSPALAMLALVVVAGLGWWFLDITRLNGPANEGRALSFRSGSAELNKPASNLRPVEVIIGDPARPRYILQVPSRIEIRTTELHDDFYLENVSH